MSGVYELLWLIPAIPIASFLALALWGSRMRRAAVSALGVGSIGASMLISLAIHGMFLAAPPPGHVYVQHLWTWMTVAKFAPGVSLYLDALSVVMTTVVTFVAFLVHLYSTEFMAGDPGYARFFAYMNLFVASMVTLLLADNLLLLYLGWEGVGLCSYLLIGFWYHEPDNVRAGQKAFIMTRIADTALALGLILLFNELGTLDIQELMRRAAATWPVGSGMAAAAAALLLGGAIGKSAQLPLQTWLPDSMAGPTPVSALIHAATMVTAGVYLIARTHVLFALAPSVEFAVAAIGAGSMLLASFSALTQHDIKRVLAYSTISQIGYMFLALGVGAYGAAIFHFLTHAFFKALLFLAAGAVTYALGGEHDIFRMGGLRHDLPKAFWTFLIGASALAGLPVITSGFYSKDLIIWEAAWGAPIGGPGLWIVGILGVVFTSLYSYRLIFLVFYGEARSRVVRRPGAPMVIAMVVLAALSIGGGWIDIPPSLGNLPAFGGFISTALPPPAGHRGAVISETASEIAGGLAYLLGLLLAWWLYVKRREWRLAGVSLWLHRLWENGWGFDWAYYRLFVEPARQLAWEDRRDVFDGLYRGIAAAAVRGNRALSATQSGRVRWYAAGIAGGTVVFVAIALFWL